MSKHRLLRDLIEKARLPVTFCKPLPLPPGSLEISHTAEYMARLRKYADLAADLRVSDDAVREIGAPVTHEVLEIEARDAAGTLASSRDALKQVGAKLGWIQIGELGFAIFFAKLVGGFLGGPPPPPPPTLHGTPSPTPPPPPTFRAGGSTSAEAATTPFQTTGRASACTTTWP